MNWFEDMQIGERRELGSFTFTAEDIIRFAQAYDPQRFHLSDEEARKTHFGKLCASGWHTASVWMKLMVASLDLNHAGGGPEARLGPSPGFTDLKWLKPVFAGDTISYSSTLAEKKEVRSRPNWGLALHRNEGVNQDGELVFSFTGKVFVARKPAATP